MYGNGLAKKRSGFNDRLFLLGIIAVITVLYLGVAYSRLKGVRAKGAELNGADDPE